ncbi:MAG: SNF2 helicase associated domain-containing protein [Bacteroidota bacterium]
MISLPAIQSFLNAYKGSSIYRRAEAIVRDTALELTELDEKEGDATFLVYSSQFPDKRYEVDLWGLDHRDEIIISCDCPYEEEVCKHGLAGLMELLFLLGDVDLDDIITSSSSTKSKSKAIHSTLSSRIHSMSLPEPVSQRMLIELTEGARDYWAVFHIASDIESIDLEENRISATFSNRAYRGKAKKYETSVTVSKEDLVTCECTSQKRTKLFSKQASAILLRLAREFDCIDDVLFPLRDHSKDVAKKLAEYGFSPDDDWESQFGLFYEYPDVILQPLDKGLSKIKEFANWKDEVSRFIDKKIDLENIQVEKATNEKKYAVLWTTNVESIPIPNVYVLQGKRKKNGEIGTPFRVLLPSQYPVAKLPKKLHELKYKTDLVDPQLVMENHNITSSFLPDPEKVMLASKEIYESIQAVYDDLLSHDHFVTDRHVAGSTIAKADLQQVYPHKNRPILSFELRKNGSYFHLIPYIHLDEEKLEFSQVEMFAYGLFLRRDQLFILSQKDIETATLFLIKGSYKVREEDLEAFTKDFILPLSEKYTVISSETPIHIEEKKASFTPKVYLKEVEDYLVMIPSFEYTTEEGVSQEVYIDGKEKILINEAENTIKLERILEDETRLISLLDSLHEENGSRRDYYYTIPVSKVMEDGWFFRVFEELKKEGVEIYGLKELKKLAYNPNPPQMQLRASSGTDWFDVEVDIQFGDQKVKLTDIRKAIVNRQNFV